MFVGARMRKQLLSVYTSQSLDCSAKRLHLKGQKSRLERWRGWHVLQPSLSIFHPLAASVDNGEKFYWMKFGVLMLSRLEIFKTKEKRLIVLLFPGEAV